MFGMVPITVFVVLSLQMLTASAVPWQLTLERFEQWSKLMNDGQFGSNSKPTILEKNSQPSVLGQLNSLHVVGISNHHDKEKLLYADETAIYEFQKSTGESSRIVGGSNTALRFDRISKDGVGADASFTFITKIVCRPSGVYIFDNDRLRKLNLDTKEVSTVAILLTDASKPVIGAVSHDEKSYFWRGTEGEGRFVMMANLTNSAAKAEMLPAGSSLIPYMDVSVDGQSLYLADIQMNIIEKVDIHTKDISFVSDYTTPSGATLIPGAIVAVSNEEILAIDRNSKSISRYDVTKDPAVVTDLCSTCRLQINNPFDIAVDDSGDVYVLDTSFHTQYPTTYKFYIKKVPAQEEDTMANAYKFL